MLSTARLVIALAVLTAGAVSWAQGASASECIAARDGSTVCPKPDATCKLTRHGDVQCSTPGGGIEVDRYGDLVCGPGYCVKDQRGDIFCSSAPRGAAAQDRYGNAACSESCVRAKKALCVVPKPAR